MELLYEGVTDLTYGDMAAEQRAGDDDVLMGKQRSATRARRECRTACCLGQKERLTAPK